MRTPGRQSERLKKTRITGPETWRFQLQLAPAPAPALPLTGGTAAITYTLIGAGVGAAAVASAIWRNRAMRRREESRQAV
ncbi:LPXTG cell wall anchor domain-containing protein [Leucobacter sp. OH1287]|uniref:LPXTG cell wall anchor domain-containing protein n=1 Tax=Leucobacter sp. OH1287 TaxID=2491049 RepID=UPI0013158942|nr:LPXTG cell wall anchor domain-containing protein [Leucobacter sp. OH1287]